jgi:molecular chaperone GrpE
MTTDNLDNVEELHPAQTEDNVSEVKTAEELPESPSDEEFEKRLADPSYANSEDEQDEPESSTNREAELQDQLLRTAAELQNVRNRAQKEVDDVRKYAVTNFAKDMIGVLENLRRAQESIADEDMTDKPELTNFAEGVELTASELLKVFSRHGLERIDPVGEEFDHDFHQALVQIPTNEFEPGKVCQVMAAGYKIKDRLLRPAMVGVAMAAPEAAPVAETPTE